MATRIARGDIRFYQFAPPHKKRPVVVLTRSSAIAYLSTVTVAPTPDTLQSGNTVQLTATTRDASNNLLTGRSISWSSSNTGVATVNSSGLVTAVATGSATITATSEGKSGTATVVVVNPPAGARITPGLLSEFHHLCRR